jgi:hypothetical protein
MKLKILIPILLILVLFAGTASASTFEYNPTLYGHNIACGDGHVMTLTVYPDAEKLAYTDVIYYLMQDKTDEIAGAEGEWLCTDYAETLHNNAENDGIECYVVCLTFGKHSQWSTENLCMELIPHGHVCNVFPLDDGSLLYVDSTQGDYISTVSEGERYKVTSVYDSDDVRTFGKIKDVKIV